FYGSIVTSSILCNRAVVSKCTFDSNGSGCTNCPGIQVGQDSTVTETVARNNGGIEIQAGTGSTLENCTADGNGTAGYGIFVGESSIVSNCTARNNGGGPEINVLDRSLIENCVADGWTGSARGAGSGISIGTASVVRGCTAENNAGVGIDVFGSNNRIEGNHVRANSIGIGLEAAATSNVVAQNDSALNGSGSVSDNCLDPGGNDFVKATTPIGAGAFDNLCD